MAWFGRLGMPIAEWLPDAPDLAELTKGSSLILR